MNPEACTQDEKGIRHCSHIIGDDASNCLIIPMGPQRNIWHEATDTAAPFPGTHCCVASGSAGWASMRVSRVTGHQRVWQRLHALVYRERKFLIMTYKRGLARTSTARYCRDIEGAEA